MHYVVVVAVPLMNGCGTVSSRAARPSSEAATVSAPNTQQTSFDIDNRPVLVSRIDTPSKQGCEPSNRTWRPELVAPILSYVDHQIVPPPGRIVHVGIVERDADDSVAIGGPLGPGEYVVEIDPAKLVLSDRSSSRAYCIAIVDADQIRVRLELFRMNETP
jgi:uncharacterized protein YceK